MFQPASRLLRGACDFLLAPVSLAAVLVVYWPVWLVIRSRRVLS
jgi:hypothetical protein